MNYELKDKITLTKELLSELETKGWQEIEHLQAQISNLAESSANNRLRQLLKNLLTSYYVFTGGIETLSGEPIDNTIQLEPQVEEPAVDIVPASVTNELDLSSSIDSLPTGIGNEESDYGVSEPFEYFVDFDEPIGDPLTDEDLYNN